jgi:HSP20 family protein
MLAVGAGQRLPLGIEIITGPGTVPGLPAGAGRTRVIGERQEDSMAITRHGEFGNLYGLRQLNRILDDAFGGWPTEQGTITSAWLPPCDVVEDANGVRIMMELPGVEPEDVRLSLENNILTIRGEKRQQQEGNESGRVHRYERSYGSFERSFSLPNTVDADKVSADYDNGVLTVSLQKAERMRPREIPLNTRRRATGNGERGNRSAVESGEGK